MLNSLNKNKTVFFITTLMMAFILLKLSLPKIIIKEDFKETSMNYLKQPLIEKEHVKNPYALELSEEQVKLINAIPTNKIRKEFIPMPKALEKPVDLVKYNTKNERCQYQKQTYVAGDIVKTKEGWMRCTTSLSVDNNGYQKEVLTWISVQ